MSEIRTEPQEGVEKKGSFWKLQGIFFEPTGAFQQINLAPSWVLPLLLAIIISGVGWVAIVNRIGLETLMRLQIEGTSRAEEMSQAQIEETAEQAANSPLIQFMMYTSATVGPVLIALIAALVLLLGLYLLGGETNFKKVFSVAAHTFFFYYMVYTGLTIIVALLISEPETLDLHNPIYTNLAFLFDRKESPVAYAAASSIDLVSFYHIYLLSLGLSIVSQKVSYRGCLGVVLVVWGIYVGAKTGLVALFA